MNVEIDADTTQLIAGTPLPIDASCTECDQVVRAGEHCIVYVTQPEDAAIYTLEQLYCTDCAPNAIPAPTRESSEYLSKSDSCARWMTEPKPHTTPFTNPNRSPQAPQAKVPPTPLTITKHPQP